MFALNAKIFDKIKPVDMIRNITLAGFSLLMAALSLIGFVSMAEQDWMRWIFGAGGILWEGGVLVVLVFMKTALKAKKTWPSFGYVLLYLCMASFSVHFGIGVSKALTDAQTQDAVQQNAVITANTSAVTQISANRESLNNSIKTQNGVISSYQAMLATSQETVASLLKNPDDKTQARIKSEISDQKQYLRKISGAEDEISRLRGELAALDKPIASTLPTVAKKEENKLPTRPQFEANSIFKGIADIYHVSPEAIKSLMFAVMLVIIQLIIAICAPSMKEVIEISTIDKTKVFTYMKHLYNTKTERLAPEAEVASKMKIDISEANEYRNYLEGIRWQNKPLIERKPGGTMPNFPYDIAVKIVKNHQSLQS